MLGFPQVIIRLRVVGVVLIQLALLLAFFDLGEVDVECDNLAIAVFFLAPEQKIQGVVGWNSGQNGNMDLLLGELVRGPSLTHWVPTHSPQRLRRWQRAREVGA